MIVSTENALRHYVWGNTCEGWELVDCPELSVKKELMPAGSRELLHYHSRSVQFFYILSGTATISVNGENKILQAHEGIEIKNGAPHCIENNSRHNLVFILSSAPNNRNDRINLG